jgi:hypothetical protein
LTVNQLRNNSAQTAVCFIDPLLRLTGLCSVWSELLFLRLSLQLGHLLSPFREKDPFTIRLDADEFPEYSGELRSDILTQAPYRIEARFDGDQTITLHTNRTGAARQRWNGHGELACGPVRVRLFVFDLEGEALARIAPRTEVRAWLRERTGVSIDRDGFRTGPDGESHHNQARFLTSKTRRTIPRQPERPASRRRLLQQSVKTIFFNEPPLHQEPPRLGHVRPVQHLLGPIRSVNQEPAFFLGIAQDNMATGKNCLLETQALQQLFQSGVGDGFLHEAGFPCEPERACDAPGMFG